MSRRPQPGDPALLVAEVRNFLEHFEEELHKGDLRRKVKALVVVQYRINDLGVSLIPAEIAKSARERILQYFLAYPLTVIAGDELFVVAGIQEWARRVRELRVEHGWAIITGVTLHQMSGEDDLTATDLDVGSIGADDYVLISTEQDREAAYRWHVANEIRRQKGAARDKILAYLRANVGKPVSGEELRYVAGEATEWARRIRELRTEHGWPIATEKTGRPDLSIGYYVLEEDRQSPEHDRVIPDAVRREVLRRDGYVCARCGWHQGMWNRDDPRHLELHHIRPHAEGGSNTEDNLITLCTVCHDLWHAANNAGDFDVWLHAGQQS